jgi:putative membrane protein
MKVGYRSAPVLAGLALLALAAQAQQSAVTNEPTSTVSHETAPDTSLSKSVTPESFATEAAAISRAEIELGRLAMERSRDEKVREYAQQMVRDHTAQTDQLKKLASQQQIALPQALDSKSQGIKQKLVALNGTEFDREYARTMHAGHEEAVTLFESASQAPQLSGELKEFAASNLAKLKQHRELAQSLHEKEGA